MERRKPASLLLVSALILLSIVGALPNFNQAAAAGTFNILVSPVQQSADNTLNQFAYYSVLVQSASGFVGTVALDASITSGPSTTYNPSLSFPGGSTVNVPPDESGFTYLQAMVGAGVASGVYTISVRGTSPPATPKTSTTSLTVMDYSAATKDFKLAGSAGVILDVVPGDSGWTDINVQSSTSAAGDYYVSLKIAPSTPGFISASFDRQILTVGGYRTNSSRLTVETTTLTPAGNYTLVVTGTRTDYADWVHSWAITVRVNGFFVAPTPMAKSVVPGESTTFNIGIQSVGTFSSTVKLHTSGVPSGMNATVNPKSVLPPPSGLASSVLTIATAISLSQGTYYLTVIGTSGSLTSSQSIAVNVGEFSVTAEPNSRTVAQGSSATYTVIGTSSGDYSGTMTLAVSGVPAGVNYEFNPSSILIPPASSNSSTLNLNVSSNAAAATHTLTVTGTSGSRSHSTTVTLVIAATPDFSLTISPSSVTVRNGSSTTLTVYINSINQFSSPVTLTASIPPATGATGSISPSSVTPPTGGYATATLTITTAATAPAGSGTVTVTGTSGTILHTATATLTISPTAGRPCIIATATYGSELSPEVYFLRLFRDRSVQTTFAGSQFMNAFNNWYYSFSPIVAEHIRNDLALRNVAKTALYPLISILYVAQWSYSVLSFAPELAVVVAGLVASSLIGVVYLTPIAFLAAELARRKRIRICPIGKPLAVAWVASTVTIVVSELAVVSPLMMFATAAFVLSTVALATKATVTETERLLH